MTDYATGNEATLALGLLRAKHPDNPDAPLPMIRAGCAQVLAQALIADGTVHVSAGIERIKAVADELAAERDDHTERLTDFEDGYAVGLDDAARKIRAALAGDQ